MAQHSTLLGPRGRPREFDIEVVVERAMNVFWSCGYHGTSLLDLLDATNLSRGSLYAAFGDKHGLFLRALDRYIEVSLKRLNAELHSENDAVAALRTCVAGYVDRTSGNAGIRGCLVVATAMELALHDAQVEQRIAGFFRVMEARLTKAFERAQAAGSLADGIEPAASAHLLLCLLEGMRVVGKTRPDHAGSLAMVEMLFDRLAR